MALDAKELAQRIIAKAVTETDHEQLREGDLVYHATSTKCLKIMGIDGPVAVVSDKENEWAVLLCELASNEAVRVNSYLEIYGDRCLMVVVAD